MTVASGASQEFGYRVVSSDSDLVGVYKVLPRVEGTLDLSKETYDSEEIGANRALKDSRHGFRRAFGDYETELAAVLFNDLFLGLVGQAEWSSPALPYLQTFTVAVSAHPTIPGASNLTLLSGSWPVIYIGETLRLASDTAGYTGDAPVLAVSSNNVTMTLFLVLAVSASVVIRIRSTSQYAQVSRDYVRFSMERANRDFSPQLYQAYTEMYVNSLDLAVEPNSLVAARWSFIGKDAEPIATTTRNTNASGSAYLVNSEGHSPMDAVSGFVVAVLPTGTEILGFVTAIAMAVDNQIDGSQVVGSKAVSPVLVWGATQMVTGQFNMLFTDDTFYNIFDEELEFSLLLRLSTPAEDGAVGEGVSFLLPRCKLFTAETEDANDNPEVLQVFSFQALRPNVSAPGLPSTQLMVLTNGDSAPAEEASTRATSTGDIRIISTGDIRVTSP